MQADRQFQPVRDRLQKGKSQDQPQQQKANSIFIARQLINGDVGQIAKRLLEFKSLKNQNYQKFSERISENLAKNDSNFVLSKQLFVEICYTASQDNTTGHQMGCILEGFFKFWKKCEIELESMKSFFNFTNEVYHHISKKYILICSSLIRTHLPNEIEYFREEGIRLVGKYFRGSKQEEEKILPLIDEFDLYDAFNPSKIVEVAMNYQHATDILYIFKDQSGEIHHNLVKLFIDKCVNRDSKDELKKCETVIKQLKLDPTKYHNMIEKMIDKYIIYQLRTFRLYFIELVINHDVTLIKALVRQLKRESRDREAKYFILKYQLKEDHYYENVSKKEKESIMKIRNILLDNDQFGPTETSVLEQPITEQRYLSLNDLGFTEEDVTFVDQLNVKEIDFQTAFASKKIGLDSQTSGGVHVFDQASMVILQIFTGSHFYVFDFANLLHNERFKQLIKYLFTHCKIYGHAHQKEITSVQKDLDLDIEEKVMQELQRSRILDTQKHFKKVCPKETKSNLAYLTEYLLKCSLSKKEQCSGWRNRPLRKAQLHYAAVDCILPLILGQKLEEMEKNRTKA